MKNILRKVSLLSSAALLALGLSAPMASAAAPTSSEMGTRWDGDVTIGRGTYVYDLTLNLATGLTYNGSAQQLITSVAAAPTHGTLYLRIVNSSLQGDARLPSSQHGWVQYETESSLTNDALKATDMGTYDVYYYVDDSDPNYNVDVNPQVPNNG